MQPNTENRSQNRSNVFLSALLVAGAATSPVRVRNLSTDGALLDGGAFPPVGATVRLVRGALSAEGSITRLTGGQAGIRFAARIDVNEWVKKSGHAGQQRVDGALAALRRNERPPGSMSEDLPPSLNRISKELDEICGRLAGSPTMTLELGEELVKLDTLARSLESIVSQAES